LEFFGMFNAALVFFSTFNPIVFSIALSLGVIAVLRRPTPVLRPTPRPQSQSWRRAR